MRWYCCQKVQSWLAVSSLNIWKIEWRIPLGSELKKKATQQKRTEGIKRRFWNAITYWCFTVSQRILLRFPPLLFLWKAKPKTKSKKPLSRGGTTTQQQQPQSANQKCVRRVDGRKEALHKQLELKFFFFLSFLFFFWSFPIYRSRLASWRCGCISF